MLVTNDHVDPGILNELSSNELFLNDPIWNDLRMETICPLIVEWKIEQIWLGKNMNPVILQHIADIKFAHLKEISLNGNCIESVEVLGSVCMPSMMKLILGHNRINKIRTIVKADWPKLKDIHVFNNVIVDMSTLTGIFSKELEWITSEYGSTDPEQSPDLRWILKLQTNELKALRLKSMHRIKDPKGRGILEKRYEGISAKYYE